jgi:polysaccharide biosynthesis transport protein
MLAAVFLFATSAYFYSERQMQDPKDVPSPSDASRLADQRPDQRSVAITKTTPLIQRDPYAGPADPRLRDDDNNLAATVQHYVRMVLKRKLLILGFAMFAVALAAVKSLLQTPLYTSVLRLQIDTQSTRVIEGGVTSPTETGSIDFMRTQFELLKSRAIAERVVSALQLQNDKDFLTPRNVSLSQVLRSLISASAKPTGSATTGQQSAAISVVTAGVEIKPVSGSRLVDIFYTDPSAARAQQIANAYAEAYVTSNIDKRFQANAYAKTFLEDQLKQLQLRLETSEKALIDFAEREKIIIVSEKSSIAENNLAATNTALGLLIAERMKNEQLWHQVENAKGLNLPQLLSNAVIDGLRGRRNELTREYEEKLETFKPDYPVMVQISNKLKEVDRQIASEVKTIKASLKVAFESSLAQENETKTRLDEQRMEVLELQKKGIENNILKREVETNRGLYNSLLQRFKEVDIAGGVGANNIFIIDRATTPGGPSGANLTNSLLMALALGLGVGLGFAYVLEALDDRVRVPEDVEQLSGLAMLGIIPLIGGATPFEDEIKNPHSQVSEAYRSLATALQFSTESGLPRSLAITSSGPAEGKSNTAHAIARHFATMGLKVLLIDADLRKPSLHIKLGQDNNVGLSNYLTGAMAPPDVIQATNLPNLAFMASGPLPPNAADLLSGTRLFSLVSVGLEVFDLIIIDAPPMLGLADAQLLASAASATMFVVAAGQQRKAVIRTALRRLQLSRTTLVGIVLTKYDSKTEGYGYGYGYGYGSDAYGYGKPVQSVAATTTEPRLEKPEVR